MGIGVAVGRAMPPGLAAILFSLLIVGIFLWELFSGGRGIPIGEEGGSGGRGPAGAGTTRRFLFHAAVVVVAGILVALTGNEIAGHEFTGARGTFTLGATFVGTLFVAIATSLPEVTVAFGAVRKARSADMALGTLLGSNGFNLVIFAIGAPFLMFNGGQSGWSNLSRVNAVNVVTAVVLTLIVLAGMHARGGHLGALGRRGFTPLLVPIYLVALYMVYRGVGA
jgi:cation:H+ antiporter